MNITIYKDTDAQKINDLEDTIKYWFNAHKEAQETIKVLSHIVDLAEDYIGDESGTADSIDFWNALYEFRGDEK